MNGSYIGREGGGMERMLALTAEDSAGVEQATLKG